VCTRSTCWATFSVHDGQVWVEDLGSRNGTRLNSEPIAEARPLVDGDLLQLASCTFQVRLPESLSGSSPSSRMFTPEERPTLT
jgi:pSer/pThr/pTyr-binding forkhead associated (FHA) protein